MFFRSGKMAVHTAGHHNAPFPNLPQHSCSTARPKNALSVIAAEAPHTAMSVCLSYRTTYLPVHWGFATKGALKSSILPPRSISTWNLQA